MMMEHDILAELEERLAGVPEGKRAERVRAILLEFTERLRQETAAIDRLLAEAALRGHHRIQ